jgi:hypothetical protein
MKERPIIFSGAMVRAILTGRKTQTRRVINPQPSRSGTLMEDWKCPFIIGQRLWVKERWQSGEFAMNDPRGTVYRATDPDWDACEGWKWKSPLFMPRSESRITLEIIAIRPERLVTISELDAMAEGIEWEDRAGLSRFTARKCFARLWDSIHGTGSWGVNPWVWVITFRVVDAKK